MQLTLVLDVVQEREAVLAKEAVEVTVVTKEGADVPIVEVILLIVSMLQIQTAVTVQEWEALTPNGGPTMVMQMRVRAHGRGGRDGRGRGREAQDRGNGRHNVSFAGINGNNNDNGEQNGTQNSDRGGCNGHGFGQGAYGRTRE
jgi:hypothetical protein